MTGATRRRGCAVLTAFLAALAAGCSATPQVQLEAETEQPLVRTELGEAIDTCAGETLFVEGLYGARARVQPGETAEIRVPGSTFRWSCGDPPLHQTAPAETNLVEVERPVASDRVHWTFYREGDN